ncbi:uncharacterized protein BO80DRAFT_421039 [Aspergillus ibericus CBS 121593]|uniref:Uncharacterized protein n=1 Tax=Aspergillus ibericus CBS 121593 TaxID=1448316 RepID=A0A395HHW4_9EURO|nr:hypothetical protein BO80DRAFT_421039 [Aspergillus ibericus CBS 121593]RAL05834.1 hypothetical protein BO80DRAFT_421039 [Aspergillus ibericus CBS 121593]
MGILKDDRPPAFSLALPPRPETSRPGLPSSVADHLLRLLHHLVLLQLSLPAKMVGMHGWRGLDRKWQMPSATVPSRHTTYKVPIGQEWLRIHGPGNPRHRILKPYSSHPRHAALAGAWNRRTSKHKIKASGHECASQHARALDSLPPVCRCLEERRRTTHEDDILPVAATSYY